MEIICILGPESSGKTTLARQIAHTQNAIYIPEYARLYTEMLLQHRREYTYADVCQIAAHQMNEWEKLAGERNKRGGVCEGVCEGVGKGERRGEREYEGVSQGRTVVMDTEWIVTQVWFEEVYGQTPNGWHLPVLYTQNASAKENAPDGENASAKENAPDGATDKPQIRFLLTAPDIEWVADPVRENGSDERRWYLFRRYEDWLKKIGARYEIIRHK